MARRNTLFRKIYSNLEADGVSRDNAASLAKEVVRQSKNRGRPGGHGDNPTPPITIADDACVGVEVECDKDYKFRTIDGKCNNLDNPYWGAMSTAFLREVEVEEYDPKASATFLDEGEIANGVPSGTYTRSIDIGNMQECNKLIGLNVGLERKISYFSKEKQG